MLLLCNLSVLVVETAFCVSFFYLAYIKLHSAAACFIDHRRVFNKPMSQLTLMGSMKSADIHLKLRRKVYHQ